MDLCLKHRFTRFFGHTFIYCLGEPLEIFAKEWVREIFSRIEHHRFAFLPGSSYEGAKSLIDKVHIDYFIGNEYTEMFHSLRKLQEGNLLVMRQCLKFLT